MTSCCAGWGTESWYECRCSDGPGPEWPGDFVQVGWVDDEGPGKPPIVQALNAPTMGYRRRRPVFAATP